MPRIALVETYFHDMDAGWTRYLFDTYGIPYRVLHPGDFETSNLSRDFDVIVFPGASKDVLTKGKYKRGDRYVVNDYPPEFREPISKKGLAKLTAFIEGGRHGRLLGRIHRTVHRRIGGRPAGDDEDGDTVEIPVRDISESLDEVSVPGAFLAVDFLPGPSPHVGHAGARRRLQPRRARLCHIDPEARHRPQGRRCLSRAGPAAEWLSKVERTSSRTKP